MKKLFTAILVRLTGGKTKSISINVPTVILSKRIFAVYKGFYPESLVELDKTFPQTFEGKSNVILFPLKKGEGLEKFMTKVETWKSENPTLKFCTPEEIVEIRKSRIELSEFTLVALDKIISNGNSLQKVFQLPGEGNTDSDECFISLNVKMTFWEIIVPIRI